MFILSEQICENDNLTDDIVIKFDDIVIIVGNMVIKFDNVEYMVCYTTNSTIKKRGIHITNIINKLWNYGKIPQFKNRWCS